MDPKGIDATDLKRKLPSSFFYRPAAVIAPDLLGCILVKRENNGKFLFGKIVETEAYDQSEQGCHGYKRRTPSNETLFGEPGHLYIYLTYGIYHCVNIVTDKANWASGVLLRAIAIPNENERIASGPALLARRFGLDRTHDRLCLSLENGIWLIKKPSKEKVQKIVQTTRIGITQAKDLQWRWYLQDSRSVSKRIKGDPCPKKLKLGINE